MDANTNAAVDPLKETKEAVLALATIGKFVIDRVKDGVDLNDAVALGQKLLLDGQFKEIVSAGIKDADKIDEELKGLNLAKAIELAKLVPQIIDIVQRKN